MQILLVASIPFIAGADITRRHSSSEKDFQWVLMYQMVGLGVDTPADLVADALLGSMLKSDRMTPWEVCGWFGVSCGPAKLVRSIFWTAQNEKMNLSLECTPPTVRHINMGRMRQRARLETRCLPAPLVRLRLATMGLWGTLDMRTLPTKLEIMDLEHNAFRGTIHLTNLPQSLQNVDLQGNSISRAVVMSADLPKNLLSINLTQKKPCKLIVFDGGAG